MRKGLGVFGKKGVASLQISLMVLSLFAFSFVISGVGVVSGGVCSQTGNDMWFNHDNERSYMEEETCNIATASQDDIDGNDANAVRSTGHTGLETAPAVETAQTSVPGSTDESSSISGAITPVLAGVALTYSKKELKELLAKGGISGASTNLNGDELIGDKTPPISVVEGNLASKYLKLDMGGPSNALATGVMQAAVAYVAGQIVGPMLGLSDGNTAALSTSLAAGWGTYQAITTFSAGGAGGPVAEGLFAAKSGAGNIGLIGSNAGLIGLGVGAIVFAAMYKDVEIEVVEFNCMPWQAPSGGDDCEICNDDVYPCSEYRCKSLGQNCEIVNSGTDEEKCVAVNPNDVNPPVITPNYQDLTSGHKYQNVKNSPPGPGFEIENLASDDGCIKSFTPIAFGINVDEPAQCKIDVEHTEKFDDMASYFGSSNLYLYNHTEQLRVPSAAALRNSSLLLENGEELTFFIRCRDKNGNENGAEYAVRMCVDPAPDGTAPVIEATSIENDGCIAEGQSSANVNFYTNEPATCKWGTQDQDYNDMLNTMACDNALYQLNAEQLFKCSAELAGIPKDVATFYVRCKDQPGAPELDRNKNTESFEFRLTGSVGLELRNVQPNETAFGAVSPMAVELYAETIAGCNDGLAICEYAPTGSTDYIRFFDTNNADGIHTQRLDLAEGSYEYSIKCIDAGGNLVEDNINFELNIDTEAPVVARIYEENEMLKIITIEDSDCVYTFDSCNFVFSDGVAMAHSDSRAHVTEWNEDKTYYIKCKDKFDNENSYCSTVVKPSSNFL